MSATPGSFVQEPQLQECVNAGTMKLEPEHQLSNETVGRHDIEQRNSEMSVLNDGCQGEVDASSIGEDGSSSDGYIRQKVLQKLTEEGQVKIAKLVNDIQSLNDMELISLYLSLPLGNQSSDPSTSASLGTSNSLHLSNQLEQSQAYTWIMSHLEEDTSTCLRKDEVYDDYRSYCDNHSMKCLNTADFGKVMKRAFPRVKPRRLGQRGQSKYCYGGLRKRIEVQPPHLPDINPETSDSQGTEGQEASSSEQIVPPGESMLSECIALILEWVEKLLGRQFNTLRQLAEYLVLNMYVNSRSCAAFALVADVHNRQGQPGPSSKLGPSPLVNADQRRRSSQKETGSPRRDSGQSKVSGSSSDGSTPPMPRPASQTHYAAPYGDSSTPPGPPGSQGVRRLVTSPAIPGPPVVKPNLLELPTNIKERFHPSSHQATHVQQSQTFPSHAVPMRAYPRSTSSTTQHHYSQHAASSLYSGQPPDAHSYQSPYTPVSDGYRPPPPLQYGGGSYAPVHRGKRPYEASNHEYYSPYYPYTSDYSTSPKRTRYTAPVGDSGCDANLYYQHSSHQPAPQPAPPFAMGTQYAQQASLPSTDPYSNVGLLSPGASSRQQVTAQPLDQSSRYNLPRVGPSPGPPAGSAAPAPPHHMSTSRGQLGLGAVPSLPRVGRSPSPLRFTSGPPSTPGVRRPSPLRSAVAAPSPGVTHNRSPMFMESPESGSSIHLPPLSNVGLARSPGSPFRSLPKKPQGKNSNAVSDCRTRPTSEESELDFPDGAPSSSIQADSHQADSHEESKVTSTVVTPCDNRSSEPAVKNSFLCGFGDDTRSSDLHTPTPPTGPDYPFVDPNAQAPQRETSGLSPPSALL